MSGTRKSLRIKVAAIKNTPTSAQETKEQTTRNNASIGTKESEKIVEKAMDVNVSVTVQVAEKPSTMRAKKDKILKKPSKVHVSSKRQTGWTMFVRHEGPVQKAKHPDFTHAQMARLMGTTWRHMDINQQAKYKRMARMGK
eukprot:CFRG0032T1